MRELLSAFAVLFLCDNLIDLLWLAGDLAGENPISTISIIFSQISDKEHYRVAILRH